MSGYLLSIEVALILFLVLSFLITLVIMIYEYRKNGYFSFLEAIALAAFIFYLQVIYLLVILPLPDIELIKSYSYTWHDMMQLIPFHFVLDIMSSFKNQAFNIMRLIQEPVFYQAFFNFVLLLPLGVFLKNLFNWSWKQILITGFLVSLSFELLQLSGLIFIYPRPYRLFDLDDLILNTSGALIGYYIAPIFDVFFPRSKKMIQKQQYAIKNISMIPQCFAYLLDIILFDSFCFSITFIFAVFQNPLNHQLTIVVMLINALLFFIITPICSNDYQTPAMKVLKYGYKEVDVKNNIKRIIRSIVIYAPFIIDEIIGTNFLSMIVMIYFLVIIILRKKKIWIDRLLCFDIVRII